MGSYKALRRSYRLRNIGIPTDTPIERRETPARTNRTRSSRIEREASINRHRKRRYSLATLATALAALPVLNLAAYAYAPAPPVLPLVADGLTISELPSRANDREPVRTDGFDPDLIVYRHGDISWLPDLASLAGWPLDTHKELGRIILRESGGCATRIGGSIVKGGDGPDSCEIIGYADTSHLSDVGLTQLNGIVYNPERNSDSKICKELKLCKREQLRDGLNNLKAALILYKLNKFEAWDACNWDKTKCPKEKQDGK